MEILVTVGIGILLVAIVATIIDALRKTSDKKNIEDGNPNELNGETNNFARPTVGVGTQQTPTPQGPTPQVPTPQIVPGTLPKPADPGSIVKGIGIAMLIINSIAGIFGGIALGSSNKEAVPMGVGIVIGSVLFGLMIFGILYGIGTMIIRQGETNKKLDTLIQESASKNNQPNTLN